MEFLIDIKKISTLPIDIHLMVENVEAVVDKLLVINVDTITIPIECIVSNAFRIVRKIKNANIKVGVAINPITPIHNLDYILEEADKISVLTFDPGIAGQLLVDSTIKKISKLAEIRYKNGYLFDLEADGSCNEKNFHKMIDAGISQCVVGSSGLFNLDNNINYAWKKMKGYMNYENY